ncbi:FAD-dependent oxidoreductase [Niabella sp. W65]|nr:FAD-dependent oxidoreductase [Niabella sp. W65]MCH7369475.1 FAD-dependent oxidoreductase [Niabella sp. W65]ULT45009.1 FAD-dependent oxidoreductase [Niabella sp. I65]
MQSIFNRDYVLQQLASPETWDVLVIGGGATGLGVALDAVSRGYRTLLVEQADFAKELPAGVPNWYMAGYVTWRREISSL